MLPIIRSKSSRSKSSQSVFRNRSMQSMAMGLCLWSVGMLICSSADAGGDVSLVPNFQLATQTSQIPSQSASFEIQCGLAGKVTFCYDVAHETVISDVRLRGHQLSFQLSTLGTCRDFKSEHVISTPRMEVKRVFPPDIRYWTEDVKTPVDLNGQQYCVKSEVTVTAELPALLSGTLIKRERAEIGHELVLTLSARSIQDWTPALQVAMAAKLQGRQEVVTQDLSYQTPFAYLAQALGNPKERITAEFRSKVMPPDGLLERGVNLLMNALRQEMVMQLDEPDLMRFEWITTEKTVKIERDGTEVELAAESDVAPSVAMDRALRSVLVSWK